MVGISYEGNSRKGGAVSGPAAAFWALVLAGLLAGCGPDDPGPGEPAAGESLSAPVAAPEKPREPEAPEPEGVIEASIDGTTWTWHVQRSHGGARSGWTPLNRADSRVVLVGVPAGDSSAEAESNVHLEFRLQGLTGKPRARDGVFTIGPRGQGKLQIDLQSARLRGQSLELLGRFTGYLPGIDAGDGQPVVPRRVEEGTFRATVHRSQGR